MKKQSKPPRSPNPSLSNTVTLQEFLRQYDPVTLNGVLRSFDSGTGWGVMKAYIKQVQRTYEVDALDLMNKDNQVQAAAYASGYAKALDDMSEKFIEELNDLVLGNTQALETPRPEDANL
jgi:hypothetical protein